MTRGTQQVRWQPIRQGAFRGAVAGALLAVVGTGLGFLYSDQIGPDIRWKLLGLVTGLALGLIFAIPAAIAGAMVGAVVSAVASQKAARREHSSPEIVRQQRSPPVP